MNGTQQLSTNSPPMVSEGLVPEPEDWYAVHTRSQHEKRVAEKLQEKGVATFLPLIAQVHRWSDRRKLVYLPLFPCYVFVCIVHSVETRLRVLQVSGVFGFVGSRGIGTPIPKKEIEDIQALLKHEVAYTGHPFLKAGQRVRIRGGCLNGIEGILVNGSSERSLVVSVELIQQSVAIRINGYDVEPV
jgi:transcription antitermination factor NusG